MKSVPKDVIYKSLDQVLRALSLKKDNPEVRSIIKFCYDRGLFQSNKEVCKQGFVKKHPFIVIEGLDGTGKTTLTKFLANRLQMKWINTPPKNYPEFIKDRDYFDNQREPIRRAYYSLGNYLVQNELLKCEQPVVMDRFWHSTAAYALAHLEKSGQSFEESSLIWPTDLIQPDAVIFLNVSEQERLRRHSTRKAFTNTAEEQTLADDKTFRENLLQLYRKVKGPPFHELMVNGEQSDSESKIFNTVLKLIPNLEESTIKSKDISSLV